MINYFLSFLLLFSVNAVFGMEHLSNENISSIKKDTSLIIVKQYGVTLNNGTQLIASKSTVTGGISVWNTQNPNQTFDTDLYYLFKNIYNERNPKS